MSRTITNHHHHYNSHYMAWLAPCYNYWFLFHWAQRQKFCVVIWTGISRELIWLQLMVGCDINPNSVSTLWRPLSHGPAGLLLRWLSHWWWSRWWYLHLFLYVRHVRVPFPCSILFSDVFYCSKHATLHYLMLDPMKILLIIKSLLYYSSISLPNLMFLIDSQFVQTKLQYILPSVIRIKLIDSQTDNVTIILSCLLQMFF